MFSHCQAAASYYDAVACAMKLLPGQVSEIPKTMIAEGYVRLQAFLANPGREHDPRNEPAMFRPKPKPRGAAPATSKKSRKRKAPPARETGVMQSATDSGSLGSRAPAIEVVESDSEPAAGHSIPCKDHESDSADSGSLHVSLGSALRRHSLASAEDAPGTIAPAPSMDAPILERPAEAAHAVVPEQVPAAAEGQFRLPALSAAAEAGLAEPVNVRPRVDNAGHRHVVDVLLPMLRQVMTDEQFCCLGPRPQVKKALDLLDNRGHRFWGAHQLYSRRRTVEDLVLQYYFDDVRRAL